MQIEKFFGLEFILDLYCIIKRQKFHFSKSDFFKGTKEIQNCIHLMKRGIS